MERKTVSGMLLSLLIIAMFGLAFSVRPVEADIYYYGFTITVTPESPTPDDRVYVTVSFETASISYIVEFSPLSQVGNEFSVDININVPANVLPMIGYEEETYYLGKLSEGSYSFNANVRVWDLETGLLLDMASYSKSFTVTVYPILWIKGHGARVWLEWHSAAWYDCLTNTLYAKIANTGEASASVRVKFIVTDPLGVKVELWSDVGVVAPRGAVTIPAVYPVLLPGTYYVNGALYWEITPGEWIPWYEVQGTLGGEGVSRDIATRFKAK